jgi:hypothetical protein
VGIVGKFGNLVAMALSTSNKNPGHARGSPRLVLHGLVARLSHLPVRTATGWRASSAAIAGSWSYRPLANRYSIVTPWPST